MQIQDGRKVGTGLSSPVDLLHLRTSSDGLPQHYSRLDFLLTEDHLLGAFALFVRLSSRGVQSPQFVRRSTKTVCQMWDSGDRQGAKQPPGIVGVEYGVIPLTHSHRIFEMRKNRVFLVTVGRRCRHFVPI